MNYKILGSTGLVVNCPKIISLDTEYSEKDVKKADLLSISIGVHPDMTYILDQFDQVQRFINEAETIYTWNGVVDWFILRRYGFDFPKEKILDAMLMEHLIDERWNHGLGDYALREFGDNYKEDFWGMYDSYQEAPKEVAYEYEMRDGCYTFRAGESYRRALESRMDLVRHTHKLQWALFDTEIRGLKVNRDLMVKTREDMKWKIEGLLNDLRNEFEEECNVWELEKWNEEIGKRKTDKGKAGVKRPLFSFSSDSQLGWMVYTALECPVIEKTKKGSPKTDYETLKTLSESNPKLSNIVQYKETKAVYATFVEGMLERVQNDDRIYPSFFINGTATGRISHGNPNMGNLPREGTIRNFFIPDDSMLFMGADYSQLEVVVEANLTNDKNLLKIINEGASKHDITAQGLGIRRDDAKTLNFALQYGAGIHKVSKILNISRQDAEDIFNRYWQLYSGVKSLKDKTAKEIEEKNQVTNLFGRTRHFDQPKNEFEKARQERQGYNHLIQGVGADITNMATYLIAEEFKKKAIGNLMFSVHDEILTQVKQGLTDIASETIIRCMGVPNEVLNFRYPVSAKLYGPLTEWSKT